MRQSIIGIIFMAHLLYYECILISFLLNRNAGIQHVWHTFCRCGCVRIQRRHYRGALRTLDGIGSTIIIINEVVITF